MRKIESEKIKDNRKKPVCLWQKLSFVLIESMLVFTAFMIILWAVDTIIDITPYDSFMFRFMDLYNYLFAFTFLQFGVMIGNAIPEAVGYNIVVAIFSLGICALIGYFSLYIFREKAKICIRILIYLLLFELALLFVFSFADKYFVLVFFERAVVVFTMMMSLRFIDSHYEYYDL